MKRGLKIKTTLMDTLKTTNNKQYLEIFLQTTDFDGYLINNEQSIKDLGQDEEFKELIEQDDTTRKSWELPPQQKTEIQRGQQQVAQEYNERQANLKPKIQQQSIEGPEMEM